jgi:hypothetical protein
MAKENSWTSCAERLPPDDFWVIGWNEAAKGAWIYSYVHGKQEWFSHSGANYHRRITHWMPLPKGPT